MVVENIHKTDKGTTRVKEMDGDSKTITMEQIMQMQVQMQMQMQQLMVTQQEQFQQQQDTIKLLSKKDTKEISVK